MLRSIFPGKGLSPGISLCAVPFLPGAVFWGGGGFPLDKSSGTQTFSRENKWNFNKKRCSKNGLPRTESYWIRHLAQKCKSSKNRLPKMQKIEENSGPRTSSFLDWKLTSAIEIGSQKGDQTMESPSSCVPLFFSWKVLVRTIPAREK